MPGTWSYLDCCGSDTSCGAGDTIFGSVWPGFGSGRCKHLGGKIDTPAEHIVYANFLRIPLFTALVPPVSLAYLLSIAFWFLLFIFLFSGRSVCLFCRGVSCLIAHPQHVAGACRLRASNLSLTTRLERGKFTGGRIRRQLRRHAG